MPLPLPLPLPFLLLLLQCQRQHQTPDLLHQVRDLSAPIGQLCGPPLRHVEGQQNAAGLVASSHHIHTISPKATSLALLTFEEHLCVLKT